MAKNKLYKNLYCIIGPSGSGKTSAADLLESKWRRRILKSYTTRPKRHEDDTDHIYVSRSEYHNLPNKVATAKIGEDYYCGTAEQVDESDYYVIDWDGFEELLRKYKGKKKGIYVIYLDCPESVCKERMQERGDNKFKIISRLHIDKYKFCEIYLHKYKDYILKTIDTSKVTTGVVAGVINAVAGKKDRQTK